MPTEDEDPRPGLTLWLQNNWPPSVVRRVPWLKSLVKHHIWRFGEDGFVSDCLLAAVEGWDLWEPERGEFGKFFLTRAKSTLRNALKWAYAEKRDANRTVPTHPGIPARSRQTKEVEDADSVRSVFAAFPVMTYTFQAVMEADTPKRAARRLKITTEGLRRRMRAVACRLLDRHRRHPTTERTNR